MEGPAWQRPRSERLLMRAVPRCTATNFLLVFPCEEWHPPSVGAGQRREPASCPAAPTSRERKRVVVSRLGRTAISVLIAIGSLVGPVGTDTALAHCPGTDPGASWRAYAAGSQGFSWTNVEGMRARIEWGNGNPCSLPSGQAFTLESVTVCRDGTCDGWLQVGWVKRQGYSGPNMYCEFAPKSGAVGKWKIYEFPLSINTHLYTARQVYDPDRGEPMWQCLLGTTIKWDRTTSNMGLASGTYTVAQGETNARHATIGKMDPYRLHYTDIRYMNDSTWYISNLNLNSPPIPYEVDEPLIGELRNWTIPHS